jgi:hypothetical protein
MSLAPLAERSGSAAPGTEEVAGIRCRRSVVFPLGSNRHTLCHHRMPGCQPPRAAWLARVTHQEGICGMAATTESPSGVRFPANARKPGGIPARPCLGLHEEAPTWQCEQAVRNCDPCISCATHFLKLRLERDDRPCPS